MGLLRNITVKPWEHIGEIAGAPDGVVAVSRARNTGLKIFLAVISSMFFLFILAYKLRMELGDWNPLADPRILWVNTLVLVAGSIAMQMARSAAGNGQAARLKKSLLTGGGLTVLFLLGQMVAWWQLQAEGLYAVAGASYAFFYLLTGLHAAHLAGGLWVWARTSRKLLTGAEPEAVRMSVQMASLYWHYLLLVWLVMFGLLLST